MIKTFFSTMRQYHIKYARFGIIYILLAIAAAVANIISIQATGDMTQAAQLGITSDMTNFLIVVAVAGGINTVIWAIMALIDKQFFGRVIYTIRKIFAGRLLTMPYSEFANKNSGEGASLFTTDVPQAASFLTTQMLWQVAQISAIFASIGFMLYINWWLTLAYFLLFPILTIMQVKIATPIGIKREEASKKRAEYNAVVTDALQNPITVLAYGLEGSIEKRFANSYADFYKADFGATKTAVRLLLVGILATFLPMFAFFFASAALVINDSMTIAEFIALTIISGPISSWLTMFSQELARLQRAKASVVRVTGFVPAKMSLEINGALVETNAKHAVKFENVTFGYETELLKSDGSEQSEESHEMCSDTKESLPLPITTKVFNSTSFTINKGEITGIAGASGSGKSTVLKLILGLYNPDEGNITISSSNITYVPQDCHLLPVSIKENITAGLPFEEEKLKKSCEKAGIYDFIMSLSDGFESVLVESASNVSGGQKQRLAMARAFYRDADILLLDEATSALDPETERAVLDAFSKYIKDNGKTAIVVAHRQTVLDMSDRVLTLRGSNSDKSDDENGCSSDVSDSKHGEQV